MDTNQQPHAHTALQNDPSVPPTTGIPLPSPVLPSGFTLPVVTFANADGTSTLTPPAPLPVMSSLASAPAISAAELVELAGGTGRFLYYPLAITIDPGDVFYLRERNQGENGIIVQVIKKEIASYTQADNKVLWRLLTAVRAQELHRVHNEPTEVIDLFLAATFKVRAAIVNGIWSSAAGHIVTRNVDIFAIDPAVLTSNVLNNQLPVNIFLGDFKGQPVIFSGQGFDKVNLITGMKGAGKSHLTKGIIDQSRQRGMSAVVFDINGEYDKLPGATVFKPGSNLKFRLDHVEPRSFLEVIRRLAPFGERTAFPATARMQMLFEGRKITKKPLDIQFLKSQADIVFPGTAEYIKTMRASYVQSLETLETFNLFA